MPGASGNVIAAMKRAAQKKTLSRRARNASPSDTPRNTHRNAGGERLTDVRPDPSPTNRVSATATHNPFRCASDPYIPVRK